MSSRRFIIRTKLRPPRLPVDLTVRPELVRRLDPVTHRFALVAAPPGYGKTTLALAWAEAWDGPVAWLTLDEGDNDPGIFLLHLAASLERAAPEGFAPLRDLAGADEAPSPRVFAGVLGNEVLDLEVPVLLVLEEYQTIRAPTVHPFVDELLAQRPDGLTVVLATRRDPPLRLSGARTRGELLDIRAEDLRLTAQETSRVLATVSGNRPPEAVSSWLHERYEGWVTGLRFVGLARRGRPWPEDPAELSALHDASLDQLLQEILDGFPANFGDQLRAASIFDRFSPALLDYVLSQEPGTGAHLIDRLESDNLFLTRLSGRASGWSRLHQLLRDLLRRELDENPEYVRSLHRRAAEWLSEHGLIEEALSHAKRADDPDLAAAIVRRHRALISETEQWSLLERWLSWIPAAAVSLDPELLILSAWSADNRGMFGLMAARLDQLDCVLSSIEDPDRRAVIEGEAAILRAVQFYQADRGQDSLTQARRALKLLPPEQAGEQAYAAIVGALAMQMIGEPVGAHAQIDHMLEGARGTGTFQTRVLMARAFVQWVEGDARGTLETARTMRAIAVEHDLAESAAAGAFFEGMALYALDDLQGAANAALPIVEGLYAPNAFFYGHASFVLALALEGLGRSEEAEQVAADLVVRRLAAGNAGGVREAEAFITELRLLRGDVNRAEGWLAKHESGTVGVSYGVYHPDLTAARLHSEGTTLDESEQDERDPSPASLVDRFRGTHNTRLLIEALLLHAAHESRRGELPAARAAVEEALALARPGGGVRPFVTADAALHPLLIELAGAELTQKLAGSPNARSAARGLMELTDRELEILGLLAERLSNKEIAKRLSISPATVKRHAATIYGKLGARGRRAAVEAAQSRGILPVRQS